MARLPSPYQNMSLINVPGINEDVVEELKKDGIHTLADLMQQFDKLFDPRDQYPPGKFCARMLKFYKAPAGDFDEGYIKRSEMVKKVADFLWNESNMTIHVNNFHLKNFMLGC